MTQANKLSEQRMALVPIEDYKRLLELCVRAADALEFWINDWAATEDEYDAKAKSDSALITELREALQMSLPKKKTSPPGGPVSEPPPRPSLQELGITKDYASDASVPKPAALLTIDDRAIQLEGD